MGQISIVLVAGLIFLFSMEPSSSEVGTGMAWTLAVTAGMTVLPALLAYFFGRMVTRDVSHSNRVDRVFLFRHLIFLFELLVLVLFVIDVYYFHLLSFINRWCESWPFIYTRQVFGIIPLIVGMMATYLAYYEVESRVHGANWSRAAYLQLRFRFLLLPLLPLLVYLALLDGLQLLPLQARIAFIRYPYLGLLVLVLLFLVAYIRSVDLLRLIWPTVPMPPSALRSRLEGVIERSGVYVRDILIWRTRGARIANAAVTGLLGRYRYVLITDKLLHHLHTNELEAVLAHELGHVRYGHLTSYLIYSLSYFLCYAAFHHYVSPFYANWQHLAFWDALFTVFFFAFYFILLFRFLSRRFEHQADLYSVHLTRDPEALINALHKLSVANRTPHVVRRWMEVLHTHPSITQRRRFIERGLRDDPGVLRFLRPLKVTYLIRILAPLLLLLFYHSVQALFASSVDIHREVSRQYAMEARYGEAIQELEQALQYAPEDVEMLYALAVLHYEQKHWRETESLLDRIIELDPEHRSARSLRKAVRQKQQEASGWKEETP